MKKKNTKTPARKTTKKAAKKPARAPGQGAAPDLTTYREKRDFGVTTEPPPEAPAKRGARPTFMVHKHDARRLHYDLRLEIDGALASWAVPKGPCFDPKVRRLAVQTEDHPLAYGSFEGRIPDGEYGAGDSIIWDRGTYETVPPGQAAFMRNKGHVEFVLSGEKLMGRWHLVRTRPSGGKPQWILFKARDEHASDTYDVVADRPESVATGTRVTRGPAPAAVRAHAGAGPIPLLVQVWPPAPIAKAAKRPPARWAFQAAGRGTRAIAAIAAGRVALQSDEARDLAAAHLPLTRALARLPVTEAVFDGEILAGGDAPARFVVHDLLWLDGADVRPLPLEERQARLAALWPARHDELVLAALREAPDEGGVTLAKPRGSSYPTGRSWLALAPAGAHPPTKRGSTGTRARRSPR